MRTRRAFGAAFAAMLVVAACGGDDTAPGVYAVQFPSTAAALATDTVQILVFGVAAADRAKACGDLIGRRLSDAAGLNGQLEFDPAPPVEVCAMQAGQRPIEVPFGEHAFLAVAQRGGADFLIGCVVMTVGAGGAPLPIPLALVNVAQPVPVTTCASVGDFCAAKCK